MSTIGNRIREERIKAGLTQIQLGKQVNLTQQAVGKWEKGLSEPDIANITKLSEIFNCSAEYLINGKNPFDDINISQLKFNNAEYIDINELNYINIPILGSIRAGIPTFADDNYIGEIAIPKKWTYSGKEYFALKIKGDSMFPKYQDGDTVILFKSETCNSGQCCAVLVNGDEATIKKVLLSNTGVTLVPINTNYDPIFYSNKDVANLPVLIQGIVVRTVRDE